jgi:hypothetical protein
MESLLRFRRERLPMGVRQQVGTGPFYLSHSSPLLMGNGDRCHSLIPSNLRQ